MGFNSEIIWKHIETCVKETSTVLKWKVFAFINEPASQDTKTGKTAIVKLQSTLQGSGVISRLWGCDMLVIVSWWLLTGG